MSNKASELLAQWIETNTARLGIKAYEFPKYDLLRPYFQCATSMKVEGISQTGSAIQSSRGMAIFVSAIEALERHIFRLDGSMETTNGGALHTDRHRALFRAASELIERDRFFCHYLTKEPVADITDVFFAKNVAARQVRDSFGRAGVRFMIGEMRRTKGLRSSLCVAKIGTSSEFLIDQGYLIGLGCEPSIDDAAEKALLEAIKGFTPIYFKHDEFRGLGLSEMLSKDSWSVHDHRNAGFSGAALHALDCLFPSDPSQGIQAAHFVSQEEDLLPQITVESLQIPEPLSDCPIYAAYARSPELQNVFSGVTTKEKVNFRRLEEFLSRPVEFRELQQHPHPMS